VKAFVIASGIAVSACMLAPAHAQQGQAAAGTTYFGVNLSQASYEESGRGTAKPVFIGASLGKVINQNFAVEGRFGTGITDDDVGGSGPRGVEVDFFLGGYAKGILPITPRVAVYGLAGVTYGDLSAGSGGLRFSSSDADFSYGIGADFVIGATTSINVEWARLFASSDYKLDALSVGLNFRF
jgi:hypothetical protein